MKCPYECSPVAWSDFDSTDGLRQAPKDGDIGVCYTCGGWWILSNGVCVKYKPTEQELKDTIRVMAESRERSRRAHQAGKGIKI